MSILNIAFQMDPMEGLNIDGDSTFVLMLEAQKRGHKLYHYLPNDLSYEDGQVFAFCHPVTVRREEGNHFEFGPAQKLNLKDQIDVVFMRQDPPFDMAYITATHLLDLVHPHTFVVNNPTSVRNAPEKLLVTQFHDLMPPTLITRRMEDIQDFRKKHGDIIIKPLFGMGGAGVFHLRPDDSNLHSLLEMFFDRDRDPVMVQRFLPEVKHGDKRIILIDGEPAGALNRVPADGQVRSNLVVGGRGEKSELTDREKEICARLSPMLKEQELIFVGIDVIGDYLTEINVTSPTGLQGINAYDGVCLEADILDATERHVAKHAKK